MPAAIDMQYFAGHEGGVGKIQDGIDDLRDFSDPLD
jgi:hypothetical protein